MSNLSYVETYLDMAAAALDKLMSDGEVKMTKNLWQLIRRLRDAQEELRAVRAGMNAIFERHKENEDSNTRTTTYP